MTALYVILIIAAVIAVILLIPISFSVYVRYDNGIQTDLTLKYGFITINMPQGGKEDKPKEKPQKEVKEVKKEKRIGAGDIAGFAYDNSDRIKNLIYAVLNYIFRRMIKIKKLKLRLVTGVDDAMQTALIFGGLSAFVFNVVGVMDKHMRLKEHSINLKPAFNEPHIFAELDTVLVTNIFHPIAIAVIALRYGIPLFIRFRRVLKRKEK